VLSAFACAEYLGDPAFVIFLKRDHCGFVSLINRIKQKVVALVQNLLIAGNKITREIIMRARFQKNKESFYCVYPQSADRHFRRKQHPLGSRAGLCVLACLGLAGCGGGGGGGDSAAPAIAMAAGAPQVNATPAPVTPPAAAPAAAPATAALSNYTGVWYGPCQGRIQDTAAFALAPGGANALGLNLVRNFYNADGCAGTAIASETLSADFTLSYGSTTSAAAILVQGTAATQVTLDLVTIAIPAYTRTRSGPGLTTTTAANGARTWCIAYADGQVCTADTGLQAAASAPGALYLDKGELLLLSPSGGGYVADGRYTRERVTTAQAQGPALQRIDTVQGGGTLATSGRTLTVNYTGWLYDASKADFKGAQFDTSVGKTPFTFRLGAGQVIAGWEQGLPGMRAGGKRTLIIPAALGYGKAGSGSAIPPDAALLFEVELVSVQ
jgi:FKBP-type peptidyl-prolyl cis-trans isomerase FkpA